MTDTDTLIARFWEALDDSPFVMLGIPEQNAHSQPMTAKFDRNSGNSLWFFTRRDNRLVQGLNMGPAMLQFAAKGHDFFGCVSGRLTIEEDHARIDQFWSNAVESWYDQGRDDPALLLLRFDPKHAELWEADLSVGGRLKMLVGASIDRSKVEDKHVETTL